MSFNGHLRSECCRCDMSNKLRIRYDSETRTRLAGAKSGCEKNDLKNFRLWTWVEKIVVYESAPGAWIWFIWPAKGCDERRLVWSAPIRKSPEEKNAVTRQESGFVCFFAFAELILVTMRTARPHKYHAVTVKDWERVQYTVILRGLKTTQACPYYGSKTGLVCVRFASTEKQF